MKKNRNDEIKKALVILQELWREIYEEAGSPIHFCPDEDLYFTIQRLKSLLGEE